MQEKQFDDKNRVWEASLNDFHPCFYYCSGKFHYSTHQTNVAKGDLWHHNRYTKYLKFLL